MLLTSEPHLSFSFRVLLSCVTATIPVEVGSGLLEALVRISLWSELLAIFSHFSRPCVDHL